MPFWASAGERCTLNLSSALRCLSTRKHWLSFLSWQAHLALNPLTRSNFFRENIIIAAVTTILKKPHRCRGRCHAGSCDNNVIHMAPSPCVVPCGSEGVRRVWHGMEPSSWCGYLLCPGYQLSDVLWAHTDIHLLWLGWQATSETEVVPQQPLESGQPCSGQRPWPARGHRTWRWALPGRCPRWLLLSFLSTGQHSTSAWALWTMAV